MSFKSKENAFIRHQIKYLILKDLRFRKAKKKYWILIWMNDTSFRDQMNEWMRLSLYHFYIYIDALRLSIDSN